MEIKNKIKQDSLKKYSSPQITELEVNKTKSGSIAKNNENTKANHYVAS